MTVSLMAAGFVLILDRLFFFFFLPGEQLITGITSPGMW